MRFANSESVSNRRLKILWITPELPYPLTSGLLRVYGQLRELGRRHEIAFVSITARKDIPAESLEALAPYTTSVTVHSTHAHEEPHLLRLIRKIPFVGLRIEEAWRRKRIAADVGATVRSLSENQDFDVVLFGGRYRIPVVEKLRIPIVFDCCDATSARFWLEMKYAPLHRRPLIYLRYLLMRRQELRMARMTPYVSFVSDRDRKALLGPNTNAQILPQGVDCEYWRRNCEHRQSDLIVFTGALDYSPNDDAARFLLQRVLPLVRETIPNVQTMIVGRDPLPSLHRIANQYRDVLVTGSVPDVRPYLERASVYVAPLRFASGVQNKVLEAMAMELPVVTTPVVADALFWDGICAPVIVGLNAQEIARRIIDLLADPAKRSTLGKRGRDFVLNHCSWKRSAEKLEEICQAAVTTTPAYSKTHMRNARTHSQLIRPEVNGN